jgi:hypothetical protein
MRLRARLGLVGVMACVIAAACSSTTDPVLNGEVALIRGITVPARAASGDTIRVAFSYVTAPCDTGLTVESRQTFDEIRFTARSKQTTLPCVATLSGVHPVGYLILPPHEAPLRLVFSEPDGNDSVRVVAP